MFNDINQLIQKLTFYHMNVRNKKELIVKIMIIYNHLLVLFSFLEEEEEEEEMNPLKCRPIEINATI